MDFQMDLRGVLVLGMPCAASMPTSKPGRPRFLQQGGLSHTRPTRYGGQNSQYGYNGQIGGSTMSTLTFRNRLGELVDVPSVAATRLKNEFGAVLEEAARGAVAITRHDAPKAVLVSYEEFQALVSARAQSLGELDAEFDALLARMQTPKARKGVQAAFNAAPAQLGRAAVKSARKRR